MWVTADMTPIVVKPGAARNQRIARLHGRVAQLNAIRKIVTAKAGDVILYEGQPRKVVAVEPDRIVLSRPLAFKAIRSGKCKV